MVTLTHEGFCSLRLEGGPRVLRFDPHTAPERSEIAVLLWGEFERVDATARAARAGSRPTVIALQPTLFWLQGLGRVDGTIPPAEVGGFKVELMPYSPIPYAAGLELVWKGLSTVKGPLRAAHRLVRRLELPDVEPVIASVTLPDGRRLLHLNLSLHRNTPEGWLHTAAARFGQPDILIAGVDAGEESFVAERLKTFRAKKLWLADLVTDVRHRLGLPQAQMEKVLTALDGKATLLPAGTRVSLG